MKRAERNSKRLVGLFLATAMTIPLAGCDGDEVELCFDQDRNGLCDDDNSKYNPQNYVVIEGKRVAFIKNDSIYVSDSDGKTYKSGIGSKLKGSSGG